MTLQTLPDDILLGILIHVTYWRKGNQIDFKQRLYLLAIFQRLRLIALPKIYNYLYIGFSRDNECEDYTNKYRKTFANYIYTNADIIALTDSTHMVKSAMLDVYDRDETYNELCNNIKALQTCANLWPNITKLTISIEHDSDDDITSESRLIKLCRRSSKYCQIIASIMPGVTELKLSNDRNRQDLSVFFSQVTDAYANQLVKLSDGYDFDYAGKNTLDVLQHLFINMSYTNIVLPRVNSHTLVSLHIQHTTIIDFWTSFMDNENDTTIEFLCLKKLRLDFNLYEYIDVDMPKIVLKFPELRLLSIVCYTDISSFFKASSFPNTMEYIYIKAPPELIAWLKRVSMPTAKKVTIVPYS